MPSILIVDDNEEMLETLERIFALYEFEVFKSENGKEAIEIAEKELPDIIILDAKMPVMDGFEACKILKSKHNTRDIPIVFLTANYVQPTDRVTGLQLGADDYLLKPFNSKELVARVKSIIKRNDILRMLKDENHRLAQTTKKIQKELKAFLEHSQVVSENPMIDQLTGLYNFNFFKIRLKEEIQIAARYGADLSLAIVYIENFDQLNEMLGHQLGNYILMKMANFLLTKTRKADILARSSEGLFYILMPHTDQEGAYIESERIRVVLSSTDYLDEEILETLHPGKRKITELQNLMVKVGVVTASGDELKNQDADSILHHVNQCIEIAKQKNYSVTISERNIEKE
ncbi:MAG: response regulator [Calditrichaeota bacterium]|nr:response regulator [Calditrichota bacterium]